MQKKEKIILWVVGIVLLTLIVVAILAATGVFSKSSSSSGGGSGGNNVNHGGGGGNNVNHGSNGGGGNGSGGGGGGGSTPAVSDIAPFSQKLPDGNFFVKTRGYFAATQDSTDNGPDGSTIYESVDIAIQPSSTVWSWNFIMALKQYSDASRKNLVGYIILDNKPTQNIINTFCNSVMPNTITKCTTDGTECFFCGPTKLENDRLYPQGKSLSMISDLAAWSSSKIQSPATSRAKILTKSGSGANPNAKIDLSINENYTNIPYWASIPVTGIAIAVAGSPQNKLSMQYIDPVPGSGNLIPVPPAITTALPSFVSRQFGTAYYSNILVDGKINVQFCIGIVNMSSLVSANDNFNDHWNVIAVISAYASPGLQGLVDVSYYQDYEQQVAYNVTCAQFDPTGAGTCKALKFTPRMQCMAFSGKSEINAGISACQADPDIGLCPTFIIDTSSLSSDRKSFSAQLMGKPLRFTAK